MIKGKTISGFEYEIEDEALDDYELLELLCELDSGNVTGTGKAISLLLGSAQKEALKEHCRTESGRVSTTKMLTEFSEILNSSKSGKNF